MQLSEIVEEHDISEISKRTRISVENLEYLLDHDWEQLKKVQALGFINIIEREYGIDLGALRRECRNYYEEHNFDEDQNIGVPIAPPEKSESLIGAFLGKLVMFAILGAMGYGAWYFFLANNKDLESNITLTPPKKESFYDSIVSMTGKWFTPASKEINKTTIIPDDTTGMWAKDIEKNTTKAKVDKKETKISKPEQKKEDVKKIEETEDANKLVEKIKAEELSKAEAKKETKKQENETQISKENMEVLRLTDIMPEIVRVEKPTVEVPKLKEQKEDITQNQKVDTIPKTEDNRQNNPKGEGIKEKKTKEAVQTPQKEEIKKEETQKEENKKPVATEGGIVVFRPLKKVWAGYTNLKNMKRTALVTRADIKFDTSKGDYILATGHGVLQFLKDNEVLLKMKNGKRHFFRIKNGTVTEISHEEFQKLNKSKVW